jgi:hypothetical protein
MSEEGAKGVTGWAFHLAGAAISWKSKTQGLVALSSTEAELIAVDGAARELRFLEKLLADVGVPAPSPTPIGQDNQSTCTLVGSTHWNARTRHVALRYHSTGDLQRAGVLQVRYLPTEHMPSDLPTKQLPSELHQWHTNVLLGLSPLDWFRRVAEKEAKSAQQHQEGLVRVGVCWLWRCPQVMRCRVGAADETYVQVWHGVLLHSHSSKAVRLGRSCHSGSH